MTIDTGQVAAVEEKSSESQLKEKVAALTEQVAALTTRLKEPVKRQTPQS